MLDRLQRIFGGGGQKPDKNTQYFYVRVYKAPNRPSDTDEIVEIRVDLVNDLSLDDDGGYFSRKAVVGSRTFKKAELRLYYAADRSLRDMEVENGELVERADYDRYLTDIADTL